VILKGVHSIVLLPGAYRVPGTYEIIASGEVLISIFGQEFSIGEQTNSAWLEVTENPNPIPGCLYTTAVNFVNFTTFENGSWGEGCDLSGDSSCTTDLNNDGVVNVSDLLLLLGEFGIECE